MVYHNILLGRPKRGLIIASEKELISRFVDNASSGIEFSLYLVETLINQGHFRNIYSSLIPIQRLFVLEILNVNIKNNKSIINVEDIKFLSEQFKRQSDCILKTVADYVETLEPQEVAAILPILGSASCKKEFSREMQKDKSLFINCLFLLRSIHAVGKQRDSPFSMVDKASDDSEDLQKHPGFGFKAQLVRVVGNLCCDNRDFQDLIRELDCIPLILDCCNIDARNPFITQWAILAIRNLCEKNTENQSVIASTDRKGVIPSTVLDQLNLKA
jgi:ataxin-10